MSNPTQSEREKTIRLAHQMFANMLEQYAPELKQYTADVDKWQTEHDRMMGRQRPTPAPEPAVDPQEDARLQAVLAEARSQKTGDEHEQNI